MPRTRSSRTRWAACRASACERGLVPTRLRRSRRLSHEASLRGGVTAGAEFCLEEVDRCSRSDLSTPVGSDESFQAKNLSPCDLHYLYCTIVIVLQYKFESTI